jgi:hypothetical protein
MGSFFGGEGDLVLLFRTFRFEEGETDLEPRVACTFLMASLAALAFLTALALSDFLTGIEAIMGVTGLMLDLLGLGQHLEVQLDIRGRVPPRLADNSGDFGLGTTLKIRTFPRHVGAVEDPTVGWPRWPLWVLLMGHGFVRVCAGEASRAWFVYRKLAVGRTSVRDGRERRGRVNASLGDTNRETSRAPDADGGSGREVVGFEFRVGEPKRFGRVGP